MADSTRRAGADEVARGTFPPRSVTATSPDGTVLARFSSEDGLVVEFRSAVRGRYTEQSLSAEVTAAITDAVGRYRDGARRGKPRSALLGTRAELRKRFEEAVAAVAVTADSPHGNVAVDWHGAQDIKVRIRSGTLKLVGSTDDQLAAEVTAALSTAMRRHSAHVIDIHRDVYRSSRITPRGGWRDE